MRFNHKIVEFYYLHLTTTTGPNEKTVIIAERVAKQSILKTGVLMKI